VQSDGREMRVKKSGASLLGLKYSIDKPARHFVPTQLICSEQKAARLCNTTTDVMRSGVAVGWLQLHLMVPRFFFGA